MFKRYLPQKHQTNRALRLNKNHPLAGNVVCLINLAASTKDVMGNAVLTSTDGTPTKTPEGYDFTSNSCFNYSLKSGLVSWQTGKGMSVLAVVGSIPNVALQEWAVALNDSGQSSHFARLGHTQYSAYNRGRFLLGRQYDTATGDAVALTVSAGARNVLIGRGNTASAIIDVNAGNRNSDVTISPYGSDNLNQLVIGAAVSGAQYWGGVVKFVVVFDDKISDADQLSLQANPYQLLEPDTQFIYMPVTVSGGISGVANITEADDTVSADATISLAGVASITEADDLGTAAATLALAGLLNVTNDKDTLVSTSTLSLSGTATITEDDDSVSSSSTIAIAGTASITEDDDTVTASESGTKTGVANITEADDTVSTSATLSLSGTATITEDDDLGSAASTLALAGLLNVTNDKDTLVSAATLSIVGLVSITEDDDTIISVGAISIKAVATITEDDDTVVAFESLGVAPTSSGLDYKIQSNKLHYKIQSNKLHYKVKT